MEVAYELKIWSNKVSSNKISEILEKKSDDSEYNWWSYKILETDSAPHSSYIDELLNILEGKYKILNQSGVDNSDIEVWILYEYDDEGKLEFSPTTMKRLGENGITLCISCWQAGGYIFIPNEQE